MVDLLQWSGCLLGAGGALLLALNRPCSGVGWLLFLASNAAWIWYGILTAAPGLVTMQLVFTATSALGIYRWLLRPLMKAKEGSRCTSFW